MVGQVRLSRLTRVSNSLYFVDACLFVCLPSHLSSEKFRENRSQNGDASAVRESTMDHLQTDDEIVNPTRNSRQTLSEVEAPADTDKATLMSSRNTGEVSNCNLEIKLPSQPCTRPPPICTTDHSSPRAGYGHEGSSFSGARPLLPANTRSAPPFLLSPSSPHKGSPKHTRCTSPTGTVTDSAISQTGRYSHRQCGPGGGRISPTANQSFGKSRGSAVAREKGDVGEPNETRDVKNGHHPIETPASLSRKAISPSSGGDKGEGIDCREAGVPRVEGWTVTTREGNGVTSAANVIRGEDLKVSLHRSTPTESITQKNETRIWEEPGMLDNAGQSPGEKRNVAGALESTQAGVSPVPGAASLPPSKHHNVDVGEGDLCLVDVEEYESDFEAEEW